jgi:putative membrane protein
MERALTRLRLPFYLAWVAGLVLFVGLIVFQGLDDMIAVLYAAGWGLVWVAVFHLAPLLADALSWRALLPATHRRSFGEITWMRWIGESINTLLPVAQVGGDIVRVRLLNRTGVPGAMASATVIVDITAGMLTLIVFALLGVALLLRHGGAGEIATQVSIGIAMFAALSLGFYLAQRAGVFIGFVRLVEHVANGHEWRSLTGGAAALDHMVERLYRRRRPVLIACAWRLLGWLLGTGEVWLTLYFLGHPVTLSEALTLESLGQAIRAAAFAIPGALGVQESGFIVLGGVLGVPPAPSLALSLVKRARELALGLPGLIAWQITEGRGAWRPRVSEL